MFLCDVINWTVKQIEAENTISRKTQKAQEPSQTDLAALPAIHPDTHIGEFFQGGFFGPEVVTFFCNFEG